MENTKLTDQKQALIDGVEFAIDNGLELSPKDVTEYHRITGSRCVFTDNVERYEAFLKKYCKKHGITKWEAHQHLLCRTTARETYELTEKELLWLDDIL